MAESKYSAASAATAAIWRSHIFLRFPVFCTSPQDPRPNIFHSRRLGSHDTIVELRGEVAEVHAVVHDSVLHVLEQNVHGALVFDVQTQVHRDPVDVVL